MKQRLITGIFYVLVMAGILVMKLLIPATESGLEFGALGIDVLFALISGIGAFEFLRAVKDVSKAQKWVAIVTCATMTPAFVITKMVTISIGQAKIIGGPALIALMGVASVGAVVVAALTIFDHEKSDIKSTAYAELCILYCGALVSVGANINHLIKNSNAATVMLFLIVPIVDTCAFFFGKLLGRVFPKKLAPRTSPNKTVIGFIGGLVGGLVAGVACWALCEYTSAMQFVYTRDFPSIVIFLVISLPTAVVAQLGDLFESAIKRSCGVKDMGKILPGHGGVLDRFDSMIFAAVPIAICFMIIR